jgi:hypothetical protein
MRRRIIFAALVFALGRSVASGYTVHAPLVANLTDASSPVSWFTETRVWNLAEVTASVQVTDIIGSGDVLPLVFTVPAKGIVDLPHYFFSADPLHPGNALATVEFTSDQPIVVDTSINTYTVTPDECPRPGVCPELCIDFFPYWAGCIPVAGPLIHGFDSYLQPGTRNGLSWLASDFESFRVNLYLVNPSPSTLTVTAVYRNARADASATLTYAVAPHSLLVLPAIFANDARLNPVRGGLDDFRGFTIAEAAATAVFSADGPFYVFAAVASNDIFIIPGHSRVVNRFAIVQPVPLP